jgi:DNA polymerase epsilon subunit 2
MEKDTFTARSIRFPPVLHRAMAVQTFPAHLGLFGEYSSTRMEQFRKEVDEKGVMIFVSDVALDVEKTTQLLAELFTGFEMALVGHSGPPPIFVLIGNFSSSSNGSRLSLVDGFNQLSRLLQRCPRLISTCKFVLVPGPNDPGPGFASCPVLPRPPLPPSLVQPLAAVASVQVATNPCRIRYGSQEIVIFREDLSKKLRRHTVNVDMQTNENTQADILPEQKALYTVMGQAHLCPLQQDVRPVYYQYDHALRLFPLPDVLVLAERGRQHSTTIKGCLTLNPGSFALTSDFMVYRPSKRAAELSRVKQ